MTTIAASAHAEWLRMRKWPAFWVLLGTWIGHRVTLRLSREGPGYLVAASRVEHVRATPGRLTIETEPDARRERLHRYLTRNVILAKRRHEGRRSALRYAASRPRLAGRLALDGRWRKAGVLVAGVVDGARFDPEVEHCRPS